jgi:hypothetical protein
MKNKTKKKCTFLLKICICFFSDMHPLATQRAIVNPERERERESGPSLLVLQEIGMDEKTFRVLISYHLSLNKQWRWKNRRKVTVHSSDY